MEWLQYIYLKITTFVDSFVSVIAYIWSMLQSLWYGMTTLLTGVMDLVQQIFSSGIF